MTKNKNYRKFLDQGIMDTLGEDDIKKALNNVKHKHNKQARSLIITLYYTGGRPNEVLRLKGKDITKERTYIKIMIQGSKGGLPRPIYIPHKSSLSKELYNYSQSIFKEMYLFYDFQNNYRRLRKTKTGQIKEYTETTDKLRYHFNKWFKNVLPESIPPYYLRHNRFTKLTEAGVSLEDLRQIKGSKTLESIRPYQHLSTYTAKKIGKKIK